MRNVRNFWLEIIIDGRSTRIKTGPAGWDGGFALAVYQRDMGNVRRVASVRGLHTNGENILRVFDETPEGRERNPRGYELEIRTKR